MVKEYLKIANDPILWIMCLPTVVLVFVQAYLFSKRAFKAAHTTNLTKEQCNKAFKVGAVSAIGPAIAVFVVMIGMMAVVGGPVTWLRLAIIGAAPTELTASTIGAKAMGVEFGSAAYGAKEFAASVWTMTLNGCGWLLLCGLFTHKMDVLKDKVAGGDFNMMGQICGAAVLGTTSYLVMSNSMAGFNKFVAALVSGIVMIILSRISGKFPKLKEYNLGIAMLVGMFIAVLI